MDRMDFVEQRKPQMKMSSDLGIEVGAVHCDSQLRDARYWADEDLGRTRTAVTVHVVSDQFADSGSLLNLLDSDSGCLAAALQDFARRNIRGR